MDLRGLEIAVSAAATFGKLARFAILGTGLVLLGHEGFVFAKGRLALRLIDRAYRAYEDDGATHLPWSWADFHPLARLDVDRLDVHRTVLSNATGSTLAFGLGLVAGTAAPGDPGNTVLAGHRDTWAAFLEQLRVDDAVRLTTRAGMREYRVESLTVVASDAVEVLDPVEQGDQLTLLTCYPFKGLAHSPWRYVVRCTRDRSRTELTGKRR